MWLTEWLHYGEGVCTDTDFVSIEQARSEPEKFENWSKLCLESMEELVAVAREQFDTEGIGFVRQVPHRRDGWYRDIGAMNAPGVRPELPRWITVVPCAVIASKPA